MAKPLHTLAVLASLRTVVFVFNAVFWLSGLVLVCVGLWSSVKLHRFVDLDGEVASALPLVLAGLGVAIVLVASVACHCAVKGTPPRIYVYATLLVLVLAGEMSLLAVGYRLRGHMDSAFHSGLSAGLQQYGKSPERTAAIDEIQSTLWCCGVSNASDWQATPWGEGHGRDKLPHSCCEWTVDAVCGSKQVHDRTAKMFNTGCYRLVMNFMVDNLQGLGLVLACVGAVHVVGVAAACVLARRLNKARYEEIREAPVSPRPASPGLPPPPSDAHMLQQARHRLKSNKSAASAAKRAQSVDWTDSVTLVAQVNQPASHEDYYSVPRRSTHFTEQAYPWAEESAPMPPSSPPPSPSRMDWHSHAHAASKRADSVHDLNRYYS